MSEQREIDRLREDVKVLYDSRNEHGERIAVLENCTKTIEKKIDTNHNATIGAIEKLGEKYDKVNSKVIYWAGGLSAIILIIGILVAIFFS